MPYAHSEFEIEATPEEIMYVLADFDRYTEFVPSVIKSQITRVIKLILTPTRDYH